uniref:COMM domain containing 9 n=1 Tax=Aquila chrysaetos chrysaetos TaxID=223781 RepID=A0A663E5C7_AQUCH
GRTGPAGLRGPRRAGRSGGRICQERPGPSGRFVAPRGSRGAGPLLERNVLGRRDRPRRGLAGRQKLVSALHSLTRHVVYHGLTRAEDILSLFPENFHQNLKNLLTKIILENISAWRNEAQASQISLPRLVDMDWRVDIKTSSDSISRMAVPTCLLQLKIQEDVALCGNSPVVSALTVELSKETLDTMLEGLGRIRDQLSAVANK